MAVSRIAADSADGTSVTVPVHQVGDLLLFWGFRDGSNSTPTVPADLTTLETVTSNSAGSALAYKIADTTTETSGTWTNATEVAVVIYRGVHQTTPVGDSAVATGSGTTLTFPALIMAVGDGTSWVAGLCFHRSINTTLSTAPTGMTNFLNEQNGGDEVAGHDTNAGVASWSEQTASVGGTSSGWAAYTVEVRAAAAGSSIKKLSGVAQASIKKVSSVAEASVKKVSGVVN